MIKPVDVARTYREMHRLQPRRLKRALQPDLDCKPEVAASI
jgi:hypothetical protein